MRGAGKLANVLLGLASCLAVLVAFEYLLVLENRFEPYPATSLTIEAKEYLFHYPVQKLIDPSPSTSKEARIFLLGDSFVAGMACVNKQQDLSAHLQQLVGHDVTVVNLGVPGKDPSNYIDLLGFLPLRRGDRVVVILYDNDIHMSRETCELAIRQKHHFAVHVPKFCAALTDDTAAPKDEEGALRRMNQILKRYKIFELIKESTYNLPYASDLFYRTEYANRWVEFDSEENRWIRSTIPIMKNISETKGANFSLLYYPNTNAISRDDPRHTVWLKFIEHARRTMQVEIGDPYPFFIRKAPRKSMVWSLTDKHPSCDAHGIMAQYVYDFISAPPRRSLDASSPN